METGSPPIAAAAGAAAADGFWCTCCLFYALLTILAYPPLLMPNARQQLQSFFSLESYWDVPRIVLWTSFVSRPNYVL